MVTLSVLVDWCFDDIVHDELSNLDKTDNCVDVTVKLSDGQARWLTFVTPDYLKRLLEDRSDPARWSAAYEPAIWGKQIVVICDLAAKTVNWILSYLDQYVELIAHSLPVD